MSFTPSLIRALIYCENLRGCLCRVKTHITTMVSMAHLVYERYRQSINSVNGANCRRMNSLPSD